MVEITFICRGGESIGTFDSPQVPPKGARIQINGTAYIVREVNWYFGAVISAEITVSRRRN